MKDKTWKTGIWNQNWDDLYDGKYNEQGNCSFSTRGGAKLSIPFGDISESSQSRETGLYVQGIRPTRYQHLFGITQDGIYLVINDVLSLGVSEKFPGTTSENFQATSVFSSRKSFDPDDLIVAADITFSGVSNWIETLTKFKITYSTTEIKLEKLRKEYTLIESERYTLKLRYGLEKTMTDDNGFHAIIYTAVHLEYSQGTTFDDLWSNEIQKLRSFLAFCLGKYPEILSLSINLKGSSEPVDVRLATITSRSQNINYQMTPIPFSIIAANFDKIISYWMSMGGNELQACTMLTSLLNAWEMPLDLQLLAATSMFEALVRTKHDNLYEKEELQKLINPMLKVADDSIRNRAQGLLSLLKRPSYSMLLDYGYEETEIWGKKFIPNWKDFKKEQIKLRNMEAHALVNNQELDMKVNHYYAQIILAYIIIMKRLDLPDEAFKSFEQSTFLNVRRDISSRHYALKN